MKLTKERVLWLLFPIVTFAAFLLLVGWLKERSPNRNDRKLQEIQIGIRQIPKYPGSNMIYEDTSSRFMDAGVYQDFRTKGSFDDIKEFYTRTLIPTGWRLKRNDHEFIEFSKGDFTISIQRGTWDSNWDYAISYIWQNDW